MITSSWPSRVYDALTPFTVSFEIWKPRRSRLKRDRFCVALAVTTALPSSTSVAGSYASFRS